MDFAILFDTCLAITELTGDSVGLLSPASAKIARRYISPSLEALPHCLEALPHPLEALPGGTAPFSGSASFGFSIRRRETPRRVVGASTSKRRRKGENAWKSVGRWQFCGLGPNERVGSNFRFALWLMLRGKNRTLPLLTTLRTRYESETDGDGLIK